MQAKTTKEIKRRLTLTSQHNQPSRFLAPCQSGLRIVKANIFVEL
jgi:hypothetical protein